MFVFLCGAVAAERLLELLWSRSQQRRERAVPKERAWAAMVALHTVTLVAAPLESRVSKVPRWLRALAGATLVGATALRVWTLRSLGDSWNVRVMRPNQIVTRGPYRWIRHPNYAAVILELAALPLLGGAWRTALFASLANALVLSRRIPFEEQLLFRNAGYRRHFSQLPRLLPWTSSS